MIVNQNEVTCTSIGNHVTVTAPSAVVGNTGFLSALRTMATRERIIIPKEGGMLLYRGLLKEEKNCSLRKVRNQSSASERERMRVLEVLKLLDAPRCQSPGAMIKKRPAEKKGNALTTTANNGANSPYHHHQCVTKSKKILHPSSSQSHAMRKSRVLRDRKNKNSIRLVVKESDYAWHPMTVSNKTKDGETKNEVIADVMKHYRSKYHECNKAGRISKKNSKMK